MACDNKAAMSCDDNKSSSQDVPAMSHENRNSSSQDDGLMPGRKGQRPSTRLTSTTCLNAQGPSRRPEMCCEEENARFCMCARPKVSAVERNKPADLVVYHYHKHCTCFFCDWYRGASSPYIRSRIPASYNEWVPNPSYYQIHKKKVYAATQLNEPIGVVYGVPRYSKEDCKEAAGTRIDKGGEDRKVAWDWAYMPPDNRLPYLLDRKTWSGMESFFLIPNYDGNELGWFGLGKKDEDGTGKVEGLVTSPSSEPVRNLLTNDLYKDYGYAPEASPYIKIGRALKVDSLSPIPFTPAESNPPDYRAVRTEQPKQRAWATNPWNTTIFVGSLVKGSTKHTLHKYFGVYGEILSVKINLGATCGFVKYTLRRDALVAMQQMQGYPIKSQRVRISWGDPGMPPLVPAIATRSERERPAHHSKHPSLPMPPMLPMPSMPPTPPRSPPVPRVATRPPEPVAPAQDPPASTRPVPRKGPLVVSSQQHVL